MKSASPSEESKSIQWLPYPSSGIFTKSSSFQHFKTTHPGIEKLFSQPLPEFSCLNTNYRAISFDLPEGETKLNTTIGIRIEKNTTGSGIEVQDISGFCKITHLLDPVAWIQGKYTLPKEGSTLWSEEYWGSAWEKMQDPMNQAYVEALAAYCLGRLREEDISPHFHHSYGAFFCIADKYYYNITDSFMSFRNCRWFWEGQEKGVFKIHIDEDLPEEVRESIFQKPQITESIGTVEELETDHCSVGADSLHSAELSFHDNNDNDQQSEGHENDDEEDDEDDEDDDIDIATEINNFPVMLLMTESSYKTMDDLLDDYELVGSKPGIRLWEEKWTAWIFQIIAALSVAQSVAGFVHNDLHTNNIVWVPTTEDYLYYSTQDGQHFKVSTYGKIFRIIDFGRSIFQVKNTLFFSDDFRKGNDAHGQYNFGQLLEEEKPVVEPNFSFDLCRFTVSVFDSIFPEVPANKKRGSILSSEPGLVVHEKESALYNLLWTWLLCDDGTNVLVSPDGSERYPDFDLYIVITSEVHNAVPSEQVRKPIFDKYRVKKTQIPKKQKVYSLFC